jgi:hypothetical protein
MRNFSASSRHPYVGTEKLFKALAQDLQPSGWGQWEAVVETKVYEEGLEFPCGILAVEGEMPGEADCWSRRTGNPPAYSIAWEQFCVIKSICSWPQGRVEKVQCGTGNAYLWAL